MHVCKRIVCGVALIYSTGKRVVTVVGSGGVGPMSRDISCEKWRLENDISHLKDEIQIATAVHNYKPCIFGQNPPVCVLNFMCSNIYIDCIFFLFDFFV